MRTLNHRFLLLRLGIPELGAPYTMLTEDLPNGTSVIRAYRHDLGEGCTIEIENGIYHVRSASGEQAISINSADVIATQNF